jgi:hypothetical protein
MAKITLTYPGWKAGTVVPATIEVPIESMSWSCLFWDYLIWPLGAAIIASVGWIIWRLWRYIARRRAVLHDNRVQEAVRSDSTRNAVSRAGEEP